VLRPSPSTLFCAFLTCSTIVEQSIVFPLLALPAGQLSRVMRATPRLLAGC